MPYLEIQAATGSVTTAYPTFTGLAACTGDTLTVRTLTQSQRAELIDFGFYGAGGNVGRVRSPFLHDDVQGIRSRYLAADPSGLTGWEPSQLLRAQDTLIVESSGTGSAAQYVYWQAIYYSDLQGPTSTFITAAELAARALEETSTEVAVTSSATAGQWGSALLSSGTGLWKANQQYAVFGYELDVQCAAMGFYGPDTGNFRCGGPGVTTRQFTRNWFLDLSENTGYPCIPVINAQNITGTQVQVTHYTASTAVNVNLLTCRLK